MLEIILSFLLLPFVPSWLYGGTLEVRDLPETLSCQEQSVCRNTPEVEGVSDFKGDNDREKNKANFKEPGLFPVDMASAAGFVPVKKNDAADIKIWAGSSVVIDSDSGTILHYDQGRKKTQIASLTKMMTAVLVLEKVKDLNEEVTITTEALRQPGTVVGCPTSEYCLSNRLYAGEKVKVIDLLKAALMNSANDAATALGIHVAGSADAFVVMMNERAKQLGLKDTNFCTPSGLEIDGKESECYSTAYDIARIGTHSLKYEKIWEIMRIPEDRFYSTDGKYMHELKSTDIIMDSTPDYLGIKTGFTPLAGRSLLAGVTDGSKKHKIVAVILNDNNRWQDMKTLTGWVFQSYNWQ